MTIRDKIKNDSALSWLYDNIVDCCGKENAMMAMEMNTKEAGEVVDNYECACIRCEYEGHEPYIWIAKKDGKKLGKCPVCGGIYWAVI